MFDLVVEFFPWECKSKWSSPSIKLQLRRREFDHIFESSFIEITIWWNSRSHIRVLVYKLNKVLRES